MILGLTGLTYEEMSVFKKFFRFCPKQVVAGAGKDEVANYLKNNYPCRVIPFAEPIKTFCKELFDFSDEQLYGPSQKRIEPDKRYKLESKINGADFLSSRIALQIIGEAGRLCYANTWVNYAMKAAYALLDKNNLNNLDQKYQKYVFDGKYPISEVSIIVMPDIRYISEFDFLRKNGAKIVRIIRPVNKIPEIMLSGHPSETGIINIPNNQFDYILYNDFDIENLYNQINKMVKVLGII
jgi:hypothetical protein